MALVAGAHGARAAAGRHGHHQPHPPAISRAREEEMRRTFSTGPDFHAATRSMRSPDITPEEEAEGRVADCVGPALNLAMLGLSLAPESLFQLTQLQHLHLAGNHLTKVPADLAKLEGLLSLNLESNALESLKGLGNLASLTALNARSNQLAKLPDEVCTLPALLSLDVGDNALTTFPQSLGSLGTLEFLRADGNQLSDVPEAVFELANLRNLTLGQNQIAAVPPAIARLEKLVILDLADNPVGVLPAEVAQLPELVQIEVKGNPMRCPPQEVCEEGALAIRGFLEDLAAGSSTCNSLDVVFLGSPGAGQAAVINALFADGKARTEPSVSEMNGARVETWPLGMVDVEGVGPVNDAQLRTWCFPGDEVSHAAYQLLMHRRCLFVVVIDIPAWTTGNHDQLVQRWVRDIRARVPSAKVLFVGNGLLTEVEESETCSGLTSRVQQYESHRQLVLQNQLDHLREVIETRERARKSNPQESLRARGWRAMKTMVATTAKRNAEQVTRVEEQLATSLQFLNDGKPLLVSSTSGKGIDELKAALSGCLSEFLHIGAPVPQKYVQLQRHFEETQAVDEQAGWDSQDAESLAIYWNDFKIQCGRVGISGTEPVRRAAKYLSLVGTILYVPEDAALKPFVFVDPLRLCEVFTYISQQEGVLALASKDDALEPSLQAGLEKLRSEGALNVAVRREIGARLHLPDHISQLVLSMMARIGMLAERPSESEGTAAGAAAMGLMAALSAMTATDMMVPSLLPEFPPASLAASWGGSWSSGWPNITTPDALDAPVKDETIAMNLQLRRVYVQCERTLAGDGEAASMSMSIFGCTLARLTQRLAAEPCVFWQHGACMAVQHELGVKGARVLVEQCGDGTVNGGQQPILTVTVRSTAQALIDGNLAALWQRIDDCVRSAAEQQPGCIVASYVACPFCQAKGSTPYLFTTTQISESWRDGERMLLSPGVGNVPMELLQPPSFAEATDADKTSMRPKRVERVIKQLESHLSERLLKSGGSFRLMGGGGSGGGSTGGSSSILAGNAQNASFRSESDTLSPRLAGSGANYTNEQLDELQEKRDSQKKKYGVRMGFFRSDAKTAVGNGNPSTLFDFQTLVPKVLNRCHIPDDQVAAMFAEPPSKARKARMLKSGSLDADDNDDNENEGGGGGEASSDLDLSEEEEAEDGARQESFQRFAKAQVRAATARQHTLTEAH